MKIKFNFLGLECIATGSVEDGNFVPDTINATGEIDTDELNSVALDELQDKMESARRGYVDNTLYFGE